ncbi:MAG: type II toxin-antitoxin system HicA family toxin [Dehalococcoidia bacterium]
MSPKLKRLSGAEVVSIMRTFGFDIHSQKGSHAKLRRISDAGETCTQSIAQ